MELALHPTYATAGVALTAASLIAITPVAPPRLELQERAVQLMTSSAADLAALTSELGQVLDTITAAGGASSVFTDALSGGLPNIGDMLNPGALPADLASGLSDTFTVLGQVLNTGLFDIADGFVILLGRLIGLPVMVDWTLAPSVFAFGLDNIFLAVPEDFFLGVADTLANQPLNDFFVQFPINTNLPAIPFDLAEYFALLQSDIQVGLNDLTTGFTDLAHGVVNEGLQLTTSGLDLFLVQLAENTVFGAVPALLGG